MGASLPSKAGGGHDDVEVVKIVQMGTRRFSSIFSPEFHPSSKSLMPKSPRRCLPVARGMDPQWATLGQSTIASQTHYTANRQTGHHYPAVQVSLQTNALEEVIQAHQIR